MGQNYTSRSTAGEQADKQVAHFPLIEHSFTQVNHFLVAVLQVLTVPLPIDVSTQNTRVAALKPHLDPAEGNYLPSRNPPWLSAIWQDLVSRRAANDQTLRLIYQGIAGPVQGHSGATLPSDDHSDKSTYQSGHVWMWPVFVLGTKIHIFPSNSSQLINQIRLQASAMTACLFL